MAPPSVRHSTVRHGSIRHSSIRHSSIRRAGRAALFVATTLATTLVSTSLLAGCGALNPGGTGAANGGLGEVPQANGSTTPGKQAEAPKLKVEVITDKLEHGWDIGFLPDGKILVTERPARLQLVDPAAPESERVTQVNAPLDDVYVQGEGGLMGMALSPNFASNREFFMCQTYKKDGKPVDIRVVRWKLADDDRSATKLGPVITGMPLNDSGRHSGCRTTFGAPSANGQALLYVGTGDAADGRNPQNRDSLGGKLLSVAVDKPIMKRPTTVSIGHRNIQGVALQPGTGDIYTAEHGPDKNDEVNRSVPGANYGWDPSQGGTVDGYDEDVPMTDTKRFPDAIPAIWQSGKTTEAICAAAFLDGGTQDKKGTGDDYWGAWNGDLVITALKGAKLLLLHLNDDGTLDTVSRPAATDDTFGRLRAARVAPYGALYVTTTNGEDDKLLKITPQ